MFCEQCASTPFGRLHWLRLWFLAMIMVIGALAPSRVAAQCTDTFDNAFLTNGGTPYQALFPMGVGSSLNAVVSAMNTNNTAFLTNSSSFVSARNTNEPNATGGGIWGRTVAGYVNTKATTTGTVDNSKSKTGDANLPPLQTAPITGVGTCKGVLHDEYGGYQFGFDLGTLNIGGNGGNLHFGVVVGYIRSKAKDETDDLSYSRVLGNTNTLLNFYSPPGSFEADTQIPSVGLYSVYTQGNFFADTLIRGDYYLMKFTDRLNGLSDQSQHARGISVGANAGYRFLLGSNWFVEPSGGLIWSHVQVDPISTPGTGGFGIFTHNEGVAKIDDIESILGRASMRVGMNTTSGINTWQTFVTGSVFREFAGKATASSQVQGPDTVVCPKPLCDLNNDTLRWNVFKDQVLHTETSRIGTFGQIGLGISVLVGDSGWLGYARGDYKFGENVEGLGFNAGVRYQW